MLTRAGPSWSVQLLGMGGGAVGHPGCLSEPRLRTPRDGKSDGFSPEGTRTRCTCTSPIISRAAARRNRRFSCVDDRPFAAAPHHTAESISTTALVEWCLLVRSSHRNHKTNASPSKTLMCARWRARTLKTSTKSSKLRSMWWASPRRRAAAPHKVPPSSTTKSPCFSAICAMRWASTVGIFATEAPNPYSVLASVTDNKGRKGLRKSVSQ